MSTVAHNPREVIRALKDWGWTFRDGAGDHVVAYWQQGAHLRNVSLRTQGEINDHTRHLIESAMDMSWDRIVAGGRLVTPARVRVTRFLQQQGGKVEDKGGRASSMIAGPAGTSVTSVTGLLLGMERDGMVRRKTNGKRTYEVQLVPGNPLVQRCLRKAERLAAEPQPELAIVEPPEQLQQPEQQPEEVTAFDLSSAQAFRQMVDAMVGYVSSLEASVANAEKLEQKAAEAMVQVGKLVEYGQAQRNKMRRMQGEMDDLRRRLK